MSTCLLCSEKDAEMEFNTPTSKGMLKALICLECWGSYPDDASIALEVAHERQIQAIHKFELAPDSMHHWGSVPEEKRPVVLNFLLKGI